jgi:hypothetical protein
VTDRPSANYDGFPPRSARIAACPLFCIAAEPDRAVARGWATGEVPADPCRAVWTRLATVGATGADTMERATEARRGIRRASLLPSTAPLLRDSVWVAIGIRPIWATGKPTARASARAVARVAWVVAAGCPAALATAQGGRWNLGTRLRVCSVRPSAGRPYPAAGGLAGADFSMGSRPLCWSTDEIRIFDTCRRCINHPPVEGPPDSRAAGSLQVPSRWALVGACARHRGQRALYVHGPMGHAVDVAVPTKTFGCYWSASGWRKTHSLSCAITRPSRFCRRRSPA